MSLQAIAHYRVTSKLGEGGMGEVYRATDTKLGRDVAIKVIPEIFAQDLDRMARFTREAQVLASLNHPNIAAIYGVEDRALIMELVEGPTLAERIAQEPIPLAEALSIVKQIAEALEYAHEKGIIHRDLKPANVKLTGPESANPGQAKVLDFGLAKAMANEPVIGNPASSPTLTIPGTMVGVIMGTAAYMSPEQARGGVADRRSDVWSFGVLFYEMLTGRQMFTGDTVSDTLAAVLRADPDWSALPAATSPAIRRLLRRCLERDRKKRLRDIGDAFLDIDEALVGPPESPAVATTQPSRAWLAWAVAALFCGGFSVLSFLHFRGPLPPEPEQVRFQILPPEKTSLTNFFTLSPDGRKLVFTARGADGVHLWVRSLDSLEAKSLTQTATSPYPFWSPDSRFLAFQLQGKLRKIEVSGGPAQTLCDVSPLFYGGAWNRDGKLLLGARGAGISSVPAEGGTQTPVTTLDATRQETGHALPSFLPDGRHFLYLRASGRADVSGIYLGDLEAKPEQQNSKRLLSASSGAVFVSSPDMRVGRVLFLRENTLMAQPFHVGRMELSSSAVPVAEEVGTMAAVRGDFSASIAGSLAYRAGGGLTYRPIWFDRQGKLLDVAGEPGRYNRGIALSPDGTRMAVARDNANNYDIWLVEFARGNSMRLTFDSAEDSSPVWSPDGAQIAYASNRNGTHGLYRKSASGAGEEQLLFKSDVLVTPTDWSRDGRFLFYTALGTKTAQDVWVLPLEGDRKPIPFLVTPFREGSARLSPDGRWVAYQSDESGRIEVYVRPFPAASGGGGQWLVSNGGGAGAGARWRRDGKELFFISLDNKVMAVEVSASPSFKAGIPKPLFVAPLAQSNLPVWDVSADGQRVLIIATPDDTGFTPLTIVMNWQTGLKK